MTTQDLDAATSGAAADLSEESPQVREALTALGRLLGASLAKPARDLRAFVCDHLGVTADRVTSVKADLVGVDAPLVQCVVARLLARCPDVVLADDTGYGAPGYDLIATDIDEEVAAPYDLAAALRADQGLGIDVVLVLTTVNHRLQLSLRVRQEDGDRARSELAGLLKRARGSENFYRGKTVRASSPFSELHLTPLPRPHTRREQVLHSPSVWSAIDANIGGLARHGATLVAADLGAARGVLIVGKPGLGKTALCRVIASELPEGTTVVLVDPAMTARVLSSLYRSIAALAPVAVFFDDIDLMAGDRRNGTAGPLLGDLLTLLDGFSPSAPVVTVATTNNSAVIDPALTRPGRFDAIIEISPPDVTLRERILQRYVSPIASVDVAPVARVTDGATGADLREIVRRAVLEHGTDLSTELLLDVVRTGRWKPAVPTGQYL